MKVKLGPEYKPSFGRRHSKYLTSFDKWLITEFLPQIAFSEDTLKEAQKYKETMLEIGFGAGEHLLHQAKNNPDILYIGAEVFDKGVAQALAKVRDEKLQNIRFFIHDVRELLQKIPADFLDKVYILFPDPWPKRRHNNRRIINKDVILSLHNALKKDGLVRVASDWPDYINWMMLHFINSGKFCWQAKSKSAWQQPSDHIKTKYQSKAVSEGRNSYFMEFSVIK